MILSMQGSSSVYNDKFRVRVRVRLCGSVCTYSVWGRKRNV